MQYLQYITEIAVAIIGFFGIISPYWANKKQDKRKANAAELKATRSILRSDIRNRCRELIQTGEKTLDEYELLLNDWHLYHDELGGNGFLDELMEQVRNLPIK